MNTNQFYNKVAVIVETRSHALLIPIIKNVQKILGSSWKIQIFHGNKNLDFLMNSELKNSIKNNDILLSSLGLSEMTQADYSELLLTTSFWESVLGEHVLIFQTDSVLSSKSNKKIEDFLMYDYVGGPFQDPVFRAYIYEKDGKNWVISTDDTNEKKLIDIGAADIREIRTQVGNGGLSLRKRSKTLELLNQFQVAGDSLRRGMEDHYYSCLAADPRNNLRLAPFEVAQEFSSVSIYHPNAFGTHQAWTGMDKTQLQLLEKSCPEFRTILKPYYLSSEPKSSWKDFKNRFFPRRYLWRDWRYWLIKPFLIWDSLKPFPKNKVQILALAQKYEREWRFERKNLLLKQNEKPQISNAYGSPKKITNSLKLLSSLEAEDIIHYYNKFEPCEKKNKKTTLDHQIPSGYALKNLCIATGADTHYFPVLNELIDSIKKTDSYKNIPINIIDCGLKLNETKILSRKLSGGQIRIFDRSNIKTLFRHDPQNYRSLMTSNFPRHYAGVASKPYLNKIFPGFRYYLWINPNYWIQNEAGLDEHVSLAEEQGFAHSFVAANEKNLSFQNYPLWIYRYFFEEKDIQLMKDMPMATDSCFCVDAQTGFFEEWGKITETSIQKHGGFYYHLCEFAIMAIMKKMNMAKYVDLKHISYYPHYSPLIYQNEPGVLYSLESPDEALSIIRPVNYTDHHHQVYIKSHKNSFLTGQTIASTRFSG